MPHDAALLRSSESIIISKQIHERETLQVPAKIRTHDLTLRKANEKHPLGPRSAMQHGTCRLVQAGGAHEVTRLAERGQAL